MSQAFDEIFSIMRQLRDPDTGCPWDREQDFQSIAPHTIEEAYEVADAIAKQDYEGLRDELGDLLLQVVYHAQIATERQLFNFDDVMQSICTKMIARHPHVFNCSNDNAAEHSHQRWEKGKEQERQAKGYSSAVDGVASNLPALSLAHKLQVRAAASGFDWKEASAVFSKINEELDEVKQEVMRTPIQQDRLMEEIGDLLFTVVNLARRYEVNPEAALRYASHKFEYRFRQMEQQLTTNTDDGREATLEDMNRIWEQVKANEKRDAYK